MATEPPYLDPLSLAAFKTIGSFPTDIAVEEFRSEFEQLQKHKELAGVTRQRVIIPFEDNNIEVFIYKPTDSGRKLLPSILFLHGGFWIAGRLESKNMR